MWSVPCLAHLTIECRDCPGSGHLGAGVSRVCLPWTAGGWKRWHAHPTKRKVETNDRDGTPHRITASPMRSSSNLLEGTTQLRGEILSPQGARLAIHVSLPTRGDARKFFFLPFDGLLFALYHFTRQHTLVRTVSPALCRFARSDTPWPQGSRTYSAQKMFTCPGHTDRPILLHFPLISLRDSARNTRDLDLGKIPQN